MNADLFRQLMAARRERRAVALLTTLDAGGAISSQSLAAPGEPAGNPLAGTLAEALANAFRYDRSGVHQSGGHDVFINVFNPPLKLVMTGAVHIAQKLIPLATLAGYDVEVIDPRGAFASASRFEGVNVRAEWPQDVLRKEALDARTAFAALTHDPKIDDPALEIALASDCFYVGALGSRKTHGARLARLTAAGFSKQQLARIDAPIGLDIGARGPAEIAISIIARITETLRKGAP